MTSLKDILKDLPKSDGKDSGADGDDMMSDPDYIRASSKFISDSLRKGHDVLQLDNGDVVTTYTKTVVTQYRWDAKKKKMVRSRTGSPRTAPEKEEE